MTKPFDVSKLRDKNEVNHQSKPPSSRPEIDDDLESGSGGGRDGQDDKLLPQQQRPSVTLFTGGPIIPSAELMVPASPRATGYDPHVSITVPADNNQVLANQGNGTLIKQILMHIIPMFLLHSFQLRRLIRAWDSHPITSPCVVGLICLSLLLQIVRIVLILIKHNNTKWNRDGRNSDRIQICIDKVKSFVEFINIFIGLICAAYY